MTIFKHELRRGKVSFIIWTAAITFFLVICVFMFPEMKDQMQSVSDMFASMGSFTAAFGMDRLNFGEFMGFYGVECGNILGIGGALFAALLGVSALSKEEKEHTAEFLLTHPVSRARIITGKLCAVFAQIILMNAIIFICVVLSAAAIGEKPDWSTLMLLHLAYFILQIEISAVCFEISAFLRRGGVGAGLGLAALMYFLNITANISESAGFLKYITPFGYTESADIVEANSLDGVLVGIGLSVTVLGIAAAYTKYCKKDIQ
ncbi:MAG: ABC transporter permease subunit [Clostridiales bacterium]|nr:ABC transporter permease subunit [Clostridiales bacterium]